MATIASAINTPFTPAVGDFIVQVTAGPADLQRRNTVGAAWAHVVNLRSGMAVICSNPIAGASYQFTAPTSAVPTVQADQ